MDFHLCKSRRGSNPDAVVNCNSPGAGGVPQGANSDLDHSQSCPASGPLSIHICPTTGGLFHMDISPNETVDALKRTVAKKLGVSHERIRLLYRDRLLKEGSLKSNQLSDGCRVTLLPHVETGLASPHPEVTVTQALENLTDSQVNDFLAGKSPLTLAMKLGKHMMFLQLQLSTVPHGAKRNHMPKPGQTRPGHLPQSSAQTLSVPNTLHHRNVQRTPSPSQPHSFVTPPPSPKSPSSSSHYTYPLASLPSVTSQTHNDVMFDPTNNTPPPSPCYIQKPIPTMPAMPLNNQPENCNEQWSDSSSEKKKTPQCPNSTTGTNPTNPRVPFLDSPALQAAKKSLSMKLKEISKQKKEDHKPNGAKIETMQRLGHGVYSGTFSGSLNPALQDQSGKPRKSISTIVHILNDLLGASHPGLGDRARVVLPTQGPVTGQAPRETVSAHAKPEAQAEQQTIRGKVERLQMALEERRLMRQARRRARGAPYTTTHRKSQGHHSHDIAMDTDHEEYEGQRSADDTMPK